MAARDLAIGLLLGGGGGQKEDLMFDELLAKSKQVSVIPVNNKFHFTYNAIQYIPGDFNIEDYIGLPEMKYTTSMLFWQQVSAQVNYTYESGQFYERVFFEPMLYSFIIAWEDDNPLYAAMIGNSMWYMSRTVEKGNIETHDPDEYVLFPQTFYLWDVDSIASDAGFNLAVYNSAFPSSNGYYIHNFVSNDTQNNTPISQIFQGNHYTIENTIRYQSYGGYSYPYAEPTISMARENVYMNTSFNIDLASPVLSHLATDEVVRKNQEIARAIDTDANMYNLSNYHVTQWGKVISS